MKQRTFESRVDLGDKESVATYLNEEFKIYAQRVIHLREKQVKARSEAKHRRRKQAREGMSMLRKKGDPKGFEKGNPEYNDDNLPKVTVAEEEVTLVKELISGDISGEEEVKDFSLYTSENIGNNAETPLEQQVEKLVEALVKKSVTTETFNTPQLLVLTQDTLVVTALYKALRDKYKEPLKSGAQVRVWKLFARHIPLKEHQDQLAEECESGKVINVYIGMPNRIKQLAQAGSIKLGSKKFKSIIFDCRKN